MIYEKLILATAQIGSDNNTCRLSENNSYKYNISLVHLLLLLFAEYSI